MSIFVNIRALDRLLLGRFGGRVSAALEKGRAVVYSRRRDDFGSARNFYLPRSSRATLEKMNLPANGEIIQGQTLVCSRAKGAQSVDVAAQPGQAIGRDISRGEIVEAEIDAFISKRHDRRVRDEGERD